MCFPATPFGCRRSDKVVPPRVGPRMQLLGGVRISFFTPPEGVLGSPGLGGCPSALCCPYPPASCCGLALCPDGASFGDVTLILKQSGKGSDTPHNIAGIHPNNAWFLLTSLLFVW